MFLGQGFLGFSRKGGDGAPGKDGVTPHIGANGNWFIGTKDTGIPARANTDIDKAITQVGLSGNTLTFTHGDGAKHAIQIPQTSPDVSGLRTDINDLKDKLQNQGVDVSGLEAKYGTLSHEISDLPTVYSYRGSAPPTSVPDHKHSAYFFNYHGQTQPLSMTIPDSKAVDDDGTLFMITNESPTYPVDVHSAYGISIDNQSNVVVGPGQFYMLIKKGNVWVTIEHGYIPASYSDLEARIHNSLHTELHTNKDINGLIDQWLRNPANQGELDSIIKALGYTKSGSGPTPTKTTLVYYGVGDDYPVDFSSAISSVPTNGDIIVNHLDQDPKKVWIAIPKPIASKLKGIVANHGLAAIWASKDITVSGDQWTVYLSPTPLADDHIQFDIKWS